MLSQAVKPRRVLIVDDDPIIARVLRHTRDKMGLRQELEIDEANDVSWAIQKINQQCYDAVTIDVILPGVSGVALACAIREHDSLVPLAYLTNMDSDDIRVIAMRNRAYFLSKKRFLVEEGGLETLIRIIQEMCALNPCVDSKRKDNEGHTRVLPATPIEISPNFARLLEEAKRPYVSIDQHMLSSL